MKECYTLIEAAAHAARQSASLPHMEYELETATPRRFSEQILGRIRGAGSVIAVFLPSNPSTPIECALAVRENKRVLIIHQPDVRVPRLLAGLPGVRTMEFAGGFAPHLIQKIAGFLQEQ